MSNAFSLKCLNNQFLVAMPQLMGSEFEQALIYILTHDSSGAMGLIVNKPKSSFHLHDVLEQIKPDQLFPAKNLMLPIYRGGPVDPERGFVLHSKDTEFSGTVDLGDIHLTSAQDVLFSIAEQDKPKKALVALGYAGWGAGQLEQEIVDNAWLTCPFDADIIFEKEPEERLNCALDLLGIQSGSLSFQKGHA